MNDRLKVARRFALGVALAAAAVAPSLARTPVAHPGYDARAQGMGGEPMPMSPARASALRDCNAEVASKSDYTWGEEQQALYRACMAGRGQPE